MKVKRILAGILTSAAFLTTLSLCVSAASSIETVDNKTWPMDTSYSKRTGNGAGYMYYHVGSGSLNDDLFAYTETNLSYGMNGYASVSLTAINNKTAAGYAEEKNGKTNGYIRTNYAAVSGTDYAKWVRFMGARYEKSNTDNPVGFNYKIS